MLVLESRGSSSLYVVVVHLTQNSLIRFTPLDKEVLCAGTVLGIWDIPKNVKDKTIALMEFIF